MTNKVMAKNKKGARFLKHSVLTECTVLCKHNSQ